MKTRAMESGEAAPRRGSGPKPDARPAARPEAPLHAPPHAASAQGSPEEVAAAIAEAFAGLNPAAVMLFASQGEALAPVSKLLAGAFGARCRILGCSTAGEFACGRPGGGGVAAVAFPAAHFRVRPVWLRDLRRSGALDWMGALRRAAEDLAEEAPDWTRFGVLLIDGLSQREELVSAMADAALPGLLTLGGSAGDGLRFERAWVALDGEARQDSAVFCLMATDFHVQEVVFDHILPTETRLVVTDARPEDRLILEINAEPAVQEYARLIGLDPAELGPSAFAENPLLARIGGRNFVRAISEVAEGGALRLMSSVETGMVMTLGRAENLTDGLEDRLSLLEAEPALVLGFDCILRRIALERAGLEETAGQIFRRHRVAGFNTYGEQHGGMHVNQTFVGLAFMAHPERSAPESAEDAPLDA
ncbi:FIST N-terminal domain-containing protein [Neomegalonema perideroedes]|uniref:FIST N-terminal domain-containing protein n=1 Tax=Neomegalonema perideroedes TaxID=217219 RepID=UPI00035EB219|nr:FIST N-terminal domain-containing protein [Neomegalonema perideroedes]